MRGRADSSAVVLVTLALESPREMTVSHYRQIITEHHNQALLSDVDVAVLGVVAVVAPRISELVRRPVTGAEEDRDPVQVDVGPLGGPDDLATALVRQCLELLDQTADWEIQPVVRDVNSPTVGDRTDYAWVIWRLPKSAAA